MAAALILAASSFAPGAQAQSQLLESVKQNPSRAKALCDQLRTFNAQGLSATSSQAVAQVARQENLSPMDAEVLTTYVIGLYCPDLR
jgi:ABC-type transporter MlaC component